MSEKLKVDHPPPGLFKGKNFMTPRVMGYYKLAGGAYAEFSEGTGFHNEPIFGVTVRPDDADDKKSKLCFSRSEALQYIESMS